VSSETLELHDAHAHAHDHAHQFDDRIQQQEAAALGMWAFLATEVLFFGGLFLCYCVFRYRYPKMWDIGSHELDVVLGGVNTVILLTSSLTMALGVRAAQLGARKMITFWLTLTILCAFGFLVVKSFEYHHKWEESLIPGRHFQVPPEVWEDHKDTVAAQTATAVERTPDAEVVFDPMGPNMGPTATNEETVARAPLTPVFSDDVRKLQLFFALYFAMTGLHAFHVIIGIALIAGLIFLNWKGWFTPKYATPVIMVGLYWHFVDIVWIFLYPLLYLMDRSAK
jgi:cytochrome c oxidase subunit 3